MQGTVRGGEQEGEDNARAVGRQRQRVGRQRQRVDRTGLSRVTEAMEDRQRWRQLVVRQLVVRSSVVPLGQRTEIEMIYL